MYDEDRRGGLVAVMARPLLRSPLDSFGIAALGAMSIAIIVNALAFQNGPHPAPIFRFDDAPPATAETASRTATQASGELIAAVQQELARIGQYDGAVDGLYGPRTDAAIRAFQITAGRAPTGEPTEELLGILRATTAEDDEPPASGRSATPAAVPHAAAARTPAPVPVPAPNRRLLAIQNLLSQHGYGPLKVDGMAGAETRAAILRFEIHRGLPPTGEVSPRLISELQAVSGVTLP